MTEAQVAHSPSPALSSGDLVAFYLRVVFLAGLTFAAIAPTLRWLEFSNTPEALNVATAQEILRSGQWLIPTLQGETRRTKPPLTAWLTALCISNQTMQEISSTNPDARHQAFLDLAWQVRLPALIASCVTLLLIAELGRFIAGPACGIASLIAAATSLLLLRYSRYGTVDVQLMVWVALTNVMLARAILRRREWVGCIGAGLALGLAMMSKGPVALVQSIVPFAIWLGWIWWRGGNIKPPRLAPLLAGLGVFIVIGFSWFVYVFMQDPSVGEIWLREVTRSGATETEPGKWYAYFSLIPYLIPWLIFLAIGLLASARAAIGPALLPMLLLFVPVLIMSLAKDKVDRYLLPVLPAAAVLVGIGLTVMPRLKLARIAHWIILGFIAIGFPIATIFLNPRWYSPAAASVMAAIGAIILTGGIAAQRRWNDALIYTTLAIMLGMQAVFIGGYRYTREGIAEMKSVADLVADKYPSAKVWNAHPTGKRPPPELGVYLNRELEWTDSPSSIQPTSIPQVLFLRQNRGDPDPVMPPPWQLIARQSRDKDWWWAFLLLPG